MESSRLPDNVSLDIVVEASTVCPDTVRAVVDALARVVLPPVALKAVATVSDPVKLAVEDIS